MLNPFRRSWMRAQAMSCLQLAYQLDYKEPLSNIDAETMKAACLLSIDLGGNERDAAALFLLAVCDTKLKISPETLTEADRKLLSKTIGGTAGMMGYMKLSTILTKRLHALSAAYTAHPGKSGKAPT